LKAAKTAFGETDCLHLRGRRISQVAKKTVLFRTYGVGVGAADNAVIKDK
jgi:hypothetical protein